MKYSRIAKAEQQLRESLSGTLSEADVKALIAYVIEVTDAVADDLTDRVEKRGFYDRDR